MADDSTVPMTLVQNEGWCLLRLEGEINIESAVELKRLLLEGLSGGQELRLDLERASGLDVTAWQLLWAGERAARTSGRGFAVQGQVPEVIVVAARETGFERCPGTGAAK